MGGFGSEVKQKPNPSCVCSENELSQQRESALVSLVICIEYLVLLVFLLSPIQPMYPMLQGGARMISQGGGPHPQALGPPGGPQFPAQGDAPQGPQQGIYGTVEFKLQFDRTLVSKTQQ